MHDLEFLELAVSGVEVSLVSCVQLWPVGQIDGGLLAACCAHDLQMSVTCQSVDSSDIDKLTHADEHRHNSCCSHRNTVNCCI